MNPILTQYRQEVSQEFRNILSYWQKYAPDYQKGGFYGRVDAQNQPDPKASKAIVLNARIMWTYAAAFLHGRQSKHLALAERAFHYINNHFRDYQNGGVYWSVEATGKPQERIKHLYGNSFAMYGLSEFYRASKHRPALDFAIDIFQHFEKYAFDAKEGGYLDALSPDWKEANSMVMSRIENREVKTMNTHLHILEALTNLYRAWPNQLLKERIKGLLEVFLVHIVDPAEHRMHLFMDEHWKVRRDAVSYGHDIEASWLLLEAAEVIKDELLIKKVKDTSLQMAEVASRGLTEDGSMNYEYDPETKHLNEEKSWWVMTEAMVGFLNAYQISGDEAWLQKSLKAWEFTKQKLVDKQGGEWFVAVKNGEPARNADKITAWKCPYHNGRACLEVMRRVDELQKKH